jgi:hypothetical protein
MLEEEESGLARLRGEREGLKKDLEQRARSIDILLAQLRSELLGDDSK